MNLNKSITLITVCTLLCLAACEDQKTVKARSASKATSGTEIVSDENEVSITIAASETKTLVVSDSTLVIPANSTKSSIRVTMKKISNESFTDDSTILNGSIGDTIKIEAVDASSGQAIGEADILESWQFSKEVEQPAPELDTFVLIKTQDSEGNDSKYSFKYDFGLLARSHATYLAAQKIELSLTSPNAEIMISALSTEPAGFSDESSVAKTIIRQANSSTGTTSGSTSGSSSQGTTGGGSINEDGLILYLKFDGSQPNSLPDGADYEDFSGNNRHAQISDAVQMGQSGRFGDAIRIIGNPVTPTLSRVTIPSDSA
jgi:hypothetical protein